MFLYLLNVHCILGDGYLFVKRWKRICIPLLQVWIVLRFLCDNKKSMTYILKETISFYKKIYVFKLLLI
jgi:hypothetical protein